MIKKLRIRFVLLALLAEFLLLSVIVLVSGYLNYNRIMDTEDSVIAQLERFETYYTEGAHSVDVAVEEETATAPPVQQDTEEPEASAYPEIDAEKAPSDFPEVSSEEAAESSTMSEAIQEQPPTGEPLPEDEVWQNWGGDTYGPEDPFDWKRNPWGKGPKGINDHIRWEAFLEYLQEEYGWEPGDNPSTEPVEPSLSVPSPYPEVSLMPSSTPVPTPMPQKAAQRHSLEIPFSSRYFIVTLDSEGNPAGADMAHIVSVTEAEAEGYAMAAITAGRERGFSDNYRFHVLPDGERTHVLFLDCRNELDNLKNSMLFTGLVSLLCMVLLAVYLFLVSRRVFQPVAESFQKQREFISAAGHELRTPLTTISADAEILEMEIGENEWLQDITIQTGRMAELTSSLLTLSRMDEGRIDTTMLEFPMSDLTEDMVHSFRSLAEKRALTVETEIQPMCLMTGNEPMIRQLISILLDNAMKYGLSRVKVGLTRQDHRITLTVENDAQPVTREQLSRFFERFYRAEQSGNSETGGYGLGLAIAKEIVQTHKGNIRAESPKEGEIRITAEFPC